MKGVIIMKKLFCIIGETARGKDTLAKILEKDYGLRQVVSYTTRPIRPGEKDGREHYFIFDDQADDMMDFMEDDIVAFTQIGNYRYFATKEELLASDIYIIDPVGLDSLKDYVKRNKLNIGLCTVYITCSDEIARERAIERGDNIDIFEKRAEDERIMFEQFDALEAYDYKYTNDWTFADLKVFASELMSILKED